jgi:hypothetical protein
MRHRVRVDGKPFRCACSSPRNRKAVLSFPPRQIHRQTDEETFALLLPFPNKSSRKGRGVLAPGAKLLVVSGLALFAIILGSTVRGMLGLGGSSKFALEHSK